MASICACNEEGTEESHSIAVKSQSLDTTIGQEPLVDKLVDELIPGANENQVMVAINYEVLESLLPSEHPDPAVQPLRHPLSAAQAFARHLGLSENATFEIISQAPEMEDASGLFVTLIQASHGGQAYLMRMVSEPDEHEQPTLWVLNDYSRSEQLGSE